MAIPIDYIAGSSIELAGAHYALFQDIEKLKNILTKKKRKVFFFLEQLLAEV